MNAEKPGEAKAPTAQGGDRESRGGGSNSKCIFGILIVLFISINNSSDSKCQSWEGSSSKRQGR